MAKKKVARGTTTRLCKNMRAHRIKRGMTMSAVAWGAKMGVSMYSDIEKGAVKDIKTSTLCRIAEALTVSPKTLLDGVKAADFPVDRRRGKRQPIK